MNGGQLHLYATLISIHLHITCLVLRNRSNVKFALPCGLLTKRIERRTMKTSWTHFLNGEVSVDQASTDASSFIIP